ncbi:hypothetical protein AMTRI_Chr08g168100 [Amborella trichopoda]|uniref:Protein kinase domain-containing protein n=1 Tax=Amborella trichopoda TaxID=13333 RepID=W1PAV2_AMBTC|nr:probable serine/threonine-protein kinase PBL1 [Amborella trichopoda]ERN04150.1 hypothetical protein AMTR_s00077p00077870 [Amborella trichopoda]|eukprot:XP_006842475.1 probable serine/threonine-protein kinase PBL1 [Amborella trichopoda]
MGCFTVSRNKKKKSEQSLCSKSINYVYENTPTTLPEPQTQTRSLQSAPPSFRNRGKPVMQQVSRPSYSRTRTLSAPSSLSIAERDALSAMDFKEQEDDNKLRGAGKDQKLLNPHPLPLPSLQRGSSSVFKYTGSFKSLNSSGPISVSGPLPLPPLGNLRSFSYEEIAAACHHFSPERCVSEGLSSTVYRASFKDEFTGSPMLEATVTRLLPSTQGLKEFASEMVKIASLQHPQLCKLIGFYAKEGSEQRMLVYERLFHGSLDRLLYGRSDGPPIDWCTRMRVALCAAQGLAFLHEEGPFQAMYTEFKTANIQIDKDFSAKLSGYGCASYNPEVEFSNASSMVQAMSNLSPETVERGLLTPKSNVYSFGVVLLELLTGHQNLDPRHPKEERNLVKWARRYLADSCRLSLIMDPKLKGRFPSKAADIVASLSLKCLQKDPSERPTMRALVETLKSIQEMKYSSRFPLQEPGVTSSIGRQEPILAPALGGRPPIVKSPSFNGPVMPFFRSRSPENGVFGSVSPENGVPRSISPENAGFRSVSPSSRMRGRHSALPPRSCSSTISPERGEGRPRDRRLLAL